MSHPPPLRWLTLSLVLALAVGCSEAPQEPPNVILISLDTVRADHLGCYGYERDTSPALDALAEVSTRYETSYATSPWTLPTHASMFTGKHSFEHGARTYPIPPGVEATNNANVLAPGHLTLAEILSAEGYRTGAVVANSTYLKPAFKVDQGFAPQDYLVKRVRAPDVTRLAVRWMAREAEESGRPFFLFVNYMDTHRPYNTTPRTDGRIPAPAPGANGQPVQSGELLNQLYEVVMGMGQPPPEALVQELINQYDLAIANLDEALGQLFEWLRREGHWDDTLIIVTSDHGEYFGEHGLVEHSKDIYQEGVRVPLLVKGPGQRSGHVDKTVASSVDLPALVLDHLPARLAAKYRKAYPYRPGNHAVVAENYYSRIKDLEASYGERFQRVRTAIFFDRWKYIHSTDGNSELYDLESDPLEQRDLYADKQALVEILAGKLEAFRTEGPPAEGGGAVPVLGEEDLEEMRRLGYL